MSLATLKRKSRRFKAHVSGDSKNGFSINGGYRNQGWVGQDTLGRHLGRTPYRGVVPVGHGGTGGKYPISIVKGGSCCTNDSNIIKRSTMNTPGHLAATVAYPTAVFNASCRTGKCALKWVKDFNPLNKMQGEHIRNVKSKAANCNKKEIVIDDTSVKSCRKTFDEEEDIRTCRETCYFVGRKRFIIAVNQKERNKITTGAVDSSEYTDTGILAKKLLPTPPSKAHFPVVFNHEGCDVDYLTPQEAIAAGYLPKDWMVDKDYQ